MPKKKDKTSSRTAAKQAKKVRQRVFRGEAAGTPEHGQYACLPFPADCGGQDIWPEEQEEVKEGPAVRLLRCECAAEGRAALARVGPLCRFVQSVTKQVKNEFQQRKTKEQLKKEAETVRDCGVPLRATLTHSPLCRLHLSASERRKRRKPTLPRKSSPHSWEQTPLCSRPQRRSRPRSVLRSRRSRLRQRQLQQLLRQEAAA